jgi:CheY-like chemotaxis protein
MDEHYSGFYLWFYQLIPGSMIAGKPYRIVLIDDVLADRYIFTRSLQAARIPCEVIDFESPVLALEFLDAAGSDESKMPHLIVIDLNMPEMSGRDLIATIRQMPHLDDVPIVLNTAYSPEMTSEVALGIGADYFFIKPVTGLHIREILILLESSLHRSR